MPRKGKGKVSEEPVVQKANSKNSNNSNNALSPTSLALRLSRMNMIHNAERNQNPNVGASTNVITPKPKSSSTRDKPMTPKQAERAEKKRIKEEYMKSVSNTKKKEKRIQQYGKNFLKSNPLPNPLPNPSPNPSPRPSPSPPIKTFLKKSKPEFRVVVPSPARPNYPFKKPTQLAILVINNDDGKRVIPNTKPGSPGRAWRNKTRHATLHFKKSGKKMTPLLKSNVKGRNPRLVVGSYNNEFNFSKDSIDRIILELSTRIRQFDVNNPFNTSTQEAANHEQYLMSLIMSAEVARIHATGWRRQVLEDMLAWIRSSKGNIFRAGG